jgi:hypothetical protein
MTTRAVGDQDADASDFGELTIDIPPSRDPGSPDDGQSRLDGPRHRGVRLSSAFTGYLWGIRTEVIGVTGIVAGQRVVAHGL